MKNKLFLMVLGAAMASCSANAAADSYKVTAQLPDDFDGQTAFLVNFDTGEKIDSVTVDNGTAMFSGTIANPAPASILVDGNRMGTLILEKGEIDFRNRTATGTPLNTLNNNILDRVNEFYARNEAAPADSTGNAIREKIIQEYDAYMDSVMNANLDNVVGYTLFLNKSFSMSLPELEAFLSAHPSLKSYTRVNKRVEAAKRKNATSPGHKFTDFAITNDSITQKLSDYVGKGKPVLVDFWASWCGPCIRETKVIKDLLTEYGPQGLEVLGVAVWDEPQNTIRAINEHQLPWPQIINAQTVPTDIYGISGIPCIMLIGPDGTILSRDKMHDELRADVKAMMEGTLTPQSIPGAE